jgi:hypothetical protein
MLFTIHPAIEADLPTIVSIVLTADADHPAVALPFANRTDGLPIWLQRVSGMFHQPLNNVFVAIADDTAEIVGYIICREHGETPKPKLDLVYPWYKQGCLQNLELRNDRESEVQVC